MSKKIFQSPAFFLAAIFLSIFSLLLTWENGGCFGYAEGFKILGGYFLYFHLFYYLIIIGVSLILWKEKKITLAAPKLLFFNLLYAVGTLVSTFTTVFLSDISFGILVFWVANLLSIFWLTQAATAKHLEDEKVLDDLLE